MRTMVLAFMVQGWALYSLYAFGPRRFGFLFR